MHNLYEKLGGSEKANNSSQQRSLFVIKVLYFCYYIAFGIYITYINVYFYSIGLSGLQIGLINTISPLIAMFSSPLWGMLSDRLGNVRFLMMMAAGGAALSSLGFTATNSYLSILLITAAYSLFTSSLVPLLDSTTLLLLGNKRERYGLQRVWGTIGFIAAAWVFGLVFEQTGLNVMFYWMAIILCIFIFILVWFPVRRTTLNKPVFKGLIRLLRHPSWLLFSASLLFAGIASSGLHIFVGILIKEIGGSDALVGKAFSLGALTEIPIMLFSAALLRRFSPRLLLGTAYILYIVRLFGFSIIPSVTWVLPLNLLHGVTFGLFWIASIAIANQIAPDNLKGTAQGALMSVLSLASVLGALLSGWIFDALGIAVLFQIYCLFVVVALFLLWWIRDRFSQTRGANTFG
jgi:MFS family permease